MTFKIDKGVPMPARKPGAGESKYPFGEMAPGDSFTAPIADGKTAKGLRARLCGAAYCWAKRRAPGARFATRVEDDGKSVRIWLLSKPAPLNPTARVATPPPVAARVHRLAGDEDDEPERPSRVEKASRKFAHDIPSFTNGAAARSIKGKRY